MVISIAAGIVIASVLIISARQERFSSLYIYPESYTNYPEGNIIYFIYGVRSYERERTGYDLEIFIGGRLVDKKSFEMEPGEVREEKETIEISDLELPAKVKLVLSSPYNTYDVHYWLKKPEEVPVPVETPPVAVPDLTPASALTPQPVPAHTPTYAAVLIDTMRGFSPEEVSISAGDAVRWVNKDIRDRKFTLVSQEGLFTVVIDVDRRFEYTFNDKGTFTFYLKEYPGIKGAVIVG